MEDYGNGYAESSLGPFLKDGSFIDTRQGTLDWYGDLDAFWFYPNSDGKLTIYTAGDFDSVGTLFGTDNFRSISYDELAFNDDGSDTDTNFRITYNLKASTEYWVVVGSYGDSYIGSYQIVFDWEVEKDVFKSAWSLGPLRPNVASVGPIPLAHYSTLSAGEVHYFRFLNTLSATNISIRSIGNINIKSSCSRTSLRVTITMVLTESISIT